MLVTLSSFVAEQHMEDLAGKQHAPLTSNYMEINITCVQNLLGLFLSVKIRC